MTRRLNLAVIFLVFCAGNAWPKWDKEDKAYLVGQFRAVQDQLQALKSEVEALKTQLGEMRQTQQQLQALVTEQRRALQEVDQLVSSFRSSDEERFSSLKAALAQIRSEQQKSLSSAATPASTDAASSNPRPVLGLPITPPGVQGYVTLVRGNTATVDLGSRKGLRRGSRLLVYKANDPNTRIGVLQVTQVLDKDNSRTRVVAMSPGVRLEFSDIVRLE